LKFFNNYFGTVEGQRAMIIHSNEAKSDFSLSDLLVGSPKSAKEGSSDAFSKLLLSFGNKDIKSELLKAPLVTNAKASKNDMPGILLDQNRLEIPQKSGKLAKSSELQMLLSGNEEEQNSALFSKELLEGLNQDQLRSLIYRAKEYLKNEIRSKVPEKEFNADSLPKTLGGLIRLAESLKLKPEQITYSELQNIHDTTEMPDAKALPAQLVFNPKALEALRKETPETHSFEALTQLLSEAKDKKTSEKKEKESPLTQSLKSLIGTSDTVENSPKNIKETLNDSINKKEANPNPLLQLLQGEQNKEHSSDHTGETQKVEASTMKTHELSTAKNGDSIDVKMKEAQQAMRHFASDLKEAAENYKPPFTRLTMKLNPEKLGEVEVTLVQRGNNVHVNIQSNNGATVAFLANNATELKAQLAHQGITNATMNFMSGGDGQQQNPHQHQNQERYKAYQSFEEFEFSNEELIALEIIIPRYA